MQSKNGVELFISDKKKEAKKKLSDTDAIVLQHLEELHLISTGDMTSTTLSDIDFVKLLKDREKIRNK